MTLHPRSALLLASATLLVACGGRSQLREIGATSTGNGGSGPTTSSGGGYGGYGGNGGNGGNGGTPIGCVIDGPPIEIGGTAGYFTSNPVLLAPGQSDLTTLVAGWTANTGSPMTPTELRHSSFQAWGPWPANGTIGPSYLIDYDGGAHFEAAPATSGFSVFFALPPQSLGLLFEAPFSPGSGDIGIGQGYFFTGSPQPLFVAQGEAPGFHLLGMSNAGAAVHEMYLDRVSDIPGIGSVSTMLACALDPIVAATAHSGADFLVAFSSGSLFVDPACGSGAGITSAFNLQIARVDENGNITAASVIGGGVEHGPITSVKMVPRSDGAWIAWTHQLGPQLHIARLDPKGQIATGPVEIPFFGDAASLSATSRGDRLALASARSAADASPLIRIEIISSAGSVETDVSIPLGPPPIGRTALLASPSGQDLLVSWTQEDPSGPQLRLARLACSLP